MGYNWNISQFKYLEYVLDESGTDEAECLRKVAIGKEVADTIRSLVNRAVVGVG